MPKIGGRCLDVLNATEFLAVVTNGADGPHLVGCWGDYVRRIGVRDDAIVMPAGRYYRTEENLKRDSRVTVLIATRQVQSTRSIGQGCEIVGAGEIITEGPLVEEVRIHFPWARGAFVVRVESWKTHWPGKRTGSP
jgi:hypothetical protein